MHRPIDEIEPLWIKKNCTGKPPLLPRRRCRRQNIVLTDVCIRVFLCSLPLNSSVFFRFKDFFF